MEYYLLESCFRGKDSSAVVRQARRDFLMPCAAAIMVHWRYEFQHEVLSVGCSIVLMPLRKVPELSCYKQDSGSSFSMHEAEPSGGKLAGNAKLGMGCGTAR